MTAAPGQAADPALHVARLIRYRTQQPSVFLDFPTAWAIQDAGVTHRSPRCSAVLAGMLCDCGAVVARWAELSETPPCLCSHPHHGSRVCPSRACGCAEWRDLLAVEVEQDVAWERAADAADRGGR